MPIDPAMYDGGRHLVRRLEAHNPWWAFDDAFDPTGGVGARRRAYRDAVKALVSDAAGFHVVGGATDAETAGLLEALVGTVLRREFRERYIRDAELRARADDLAVPPENVLRLPLGASPLYQVRPTSGLRGVVDHFRTHVATPGDRRYLFLEGLHELRRPNRRGGDADADWLAALAAIWAGTDDLTVVASVPSSTFVGDRLAAHPSVGASADEWRLHSVEHLGFEEYLRLRHRRLDVAPRGQRFDSSRARASFRTAVREGDAAALASGVRAAESERALEPSTLRRELTSYAVAGGRLTAALDRAGVDVGDDAFERLLRNRGDRPLGEFQAGVVDALTEGVTSAADRLYGLRDSAGPSRLAAVVANDRPAGPVEFDAVCAVLDVDRRTLRERHLRVLGELGAVGGTEAYANERPRSLGLFHRDPSVLAAFGGFDLRDALRQEPGLAPDLWRAAAYDHTVRLSEALNDPRDPKRGVVKHWSGDDGIVDFVLKVDGRPVPVAFSPERAIAALERGGGSDAGAYEALGAFLRRTESLDDADPLGRRHYADVPDSVVERRAAVVDDERYFGTRRGDAAVDGSAPFGIVVTNARAAIDDGVVVDESGPLPIVQLPLWTYLRLA